MSNISIKAEMHLLIEQVKRVVSNINQQRDQTERKMVRKLDDLQSRLSKCTRVFNQAVKFKNRPYFDYEVNF